MNVKLFSLFDTQNLVERLSSFFSYDIGQIALHTFPDGESLIRFDTPVKDCDVILVANLMHPNEKCLPLLFAADTAKSLGASRVGLVAPYLPYMRQDTVFHPGEGISAHYFATLLSQHVDWLVTVEPHLHRTKNLNDIFSIPTEVVKTDRAIAEWISKNISNPFLIGPDEESDHWISNIAHRLGVKYAVLQKERLGDAQVKVKVPSHIVIGDAVPVIIDDVISTGKTLLNTIEQLAFFSNQKPIVIVAHILPQKDIFDYPLISCNIFNKKNNNEINIFVDIAHAVKNNFSKQF